MAGGSESEMKLTKKKAIELSIKKWEDARSRPMELAQGDLESYKFEGFGFKGCPLCEWASTCCKVCPLTKVWGMNCDNKFVETDYGGFWDGWDGDKAKRIAMCDTILEALRKCK